MSFRNANDGDHQWMTAVPDLVLLLDWDGVIVDVPATAFCDRDDWSPPSWIGKTVHEVMPAAVAGRFMAAIGALAQVRSVECFTYDEVVNGKTYRYEGRATRSDSSCVVVLVRDISEQWTSGELFHHSRSLSRTVEHINGFGTWEDDRRRMVLTWSDEIFRIFGLRPHQLVPSVALFFSFIHPDDRASVETAFESLLEKRVPYDVTHRIIHWNGKVRWVRERAECFYDTGGTPVRLVGTTQDVTEQVAADNKVQHAYAIIEERAVQLAALSRELSVVEQRERRNLASLLHDNLQQMLVGAKYHVAPLLRELHDDRLVSVARSVTAALDEAIGECRMLTTTLWPPVLQEDGLAAALRWLVIEMEKKYGLDVAVSVEGERPIEDGLRVVMFAAVRELLFNVFKHSGVNACAVTLSVTPSDRLCIVVSDGGRGFDLATLAEWSGYSNGFGLFAIHERLKVHDAELLMESAPGAGSRFTLTGPAPSRA